MNKQAEVIKLAGQITELLQKGGDDEELDPSVAIDALLLCVHQLSGFYDFCNIISRFQRR